MQPTPLDEEPIPPDLTPDQWTAIVKRLELSAQQARVLALVAADCKEQAIAKCLGIRPDTVKEYMKRIRLRLGERTRAGLVRRIYTMAANGMSMNAAPEVSPAPATPAKASGKSSW